jgi:Xaa-Pro aminopeptidase
MIFDCHGAKNGYCFDGGKSWFVGNQPTPEAPKIADAIGATMLDVVAAMRPGARISELQALGRRTMREHGLTRADHALIFFHGVGLSHNELETPQGSEWEYQHRLDWTLEDGMVVAPHLAYPGDVSERYYLEDSVLVTPDGGSRLFTWDVEPLTGDR